LKIFFLLNFNPLGESGASGNRILTIIEGLKKLGVKIVLVITRGYLTVEEKKIFGPKGCHNSVVYYYASEFVMNNKYKFVFSRDILKYFPPNRKVKKLIQAEEPDAVWFSNSYNVFKMIELICKYKNAGCKLIQEQNEIPDIMLSPDELNFYKTKIVPMVNIFLVMTTGLFNYFKNIASPDALLFHLPMTVDLTRFKVLKEHQLAKPYIIYCGSLNNEKDGVDILIHAFGKISGQFPLYKLYIIGQEYPVFLAKQKPLIEKYNLQEKVIYLGIKHRDEIPSLLMDADVLALARPGSKQAQYGFPTKLGEYLATGKPVCVTRTGEIPFYLKDEEGAFLASPGDVDSFADALLRAISDKNKANLVGANGRKIAEEHFDMDVQIKNLYEFLVKNLSPISK
jgi:glycosyltransferase involved in cell wall biosynthesis